MSKLKSLSKSVVALAIAGTLAVGGIAFALGISATTAVVQLTATEDTQLLPGRYRNAPNYFYAQKTLNVDADNDGELDIVYVPAGHGDTLINSYDYDEDGNVTVIFQKGRVKAGPYDVYTYFAEFGLGGIDSDTGNTVVEESYIVEGPDANTGFATAVIPAEAIDSDGKTLIAFRADGTPTGHASSAYLILEPELVQVAFTRA
jgi:hypothetical protein